MPTPTNLVDMLEAIARDPAVIRSVRESSVGPLPDIDDAFWLRRAAIALYGDTAHSTNALTAIESRRHGKPADKVEVAVTVRARDLTDDQLAEIIAREQAQTLARQPERKLLPVTVVDAELDK